MTRVRLWVCRGFLAIAVVLVFGPIIDSTLTSIVHLVAFSDSQPYHPVSFPYPIPDTGTYAIALYLILTLAALGLTAIISSPIGGFKKTLSDSDVGQSQELKSHQSRLALLRVRLNKRAIFTALRDYLIGIPAYFVFITITKASFRIVNPTYANAVSPDQIITWGDELSPFGQKLLLGFGGAYEEVTICVLVAALVYRKRSLAPAAILLSVAIRILTHFYYGVTPAFLMVTAWAVFAIVFYLKTHRWFPLYVTHFWSNFAHPDGWMNRPDVPVMQWWVNYGYSLLFIAGIGVLSVLVAYRLVSAPTNDAGGTSVYFNKLACWWSSVGKERAFAIQRLCRVAISVLFVIPFGLILTFRIAHIFHMPYPEQLRPDKLANIGGTNIALLLWIALNVAVLFTFYRTRIGLATYAGVLPYRHRSAGSFAKYVLLQKILLGLAAFCIGFTALEYGTKFFDICRIFIRFEFLDRATWADPQFFSATTTVQGIVPALIASLMMAYQGLIALGISLVVLRSFNRARYAILLAIILNILVYSYFDVVGMILVAGVWAIFAVFVHYQTGLLLLLWAAQFAQILITYIRHSGNSDEMPAYLSVVASYEKWVIVAAMVAILCLAAWWFRAKENNSAVYEVRS
ncbi:hypothetical protein [Trueperella sp. LYQ141]|uniref:hypothetical protein n=1 Tax=Trueperella sp. LYQ141 TaxID=3391058 RepID=UPI003983C991